MKRVKAKDLSAISEIDFAKLAAYIDGEGHIQIGHAVHKDPKFKGTRTRYEYVRLYIGNTDPRLALWLETNFGGKVYFDRQKNVKWKPCVRWYLHGRQASGILRRCLPHFILKREQAELAVAMQDTMQKFGCKKTPQSLIEEREVIRKKLRSLTARGPHAIASGE